MTEGGLVSQGAGRVETSAVDPRFAATFLYGSVAIVAIAIAVTRWLYVAWAGPDAMQYEAARIRSAPLASGNTASLSVTQRQDRLDYEQGQKNLLASYGWVDREKGIARIPLEKAMQRLATAKEGAK